MNNFKKLLRPRDKWSLKEFTNLDHQSITPIVDTRLEAAAILVFISKVTRGGLQYCRTWWWNVIMLFLVKVGYQGIALLAASEFRQVNQWELIKWSLKYLTS